MAESRLAGRGQLSSQSSIGEGEGKNRYRDVEILLGKSKQEIKKLINQVATEKKKVDEYKLLSETAEKRVLESSEGMQKLQRKKNRLSTIVENYRLEAEKANEKLAPLNTKIKELEDKYGTLLTEKTALQTESDGWKKRSDQLVEKSFKMNPEELKRLQDAEAKLTKQLTMLTAEKKNGTIQYNNLQRELVALKSTLHTAQLEAKKNKEELDKRTVDLKTLIIRETTQKNQLNNLSRLNNELKKKSEEVKKKTDELEKSVQELEKNEQENATTMSKMTKDLAAAQNKIAEVKSGGEDINALKLRITTLTEENTKNAEEMLKSKTSIKSLKAIGRQFREKADSANVEIASLKEELVKVKESVSKLEADIVAKTNELIETKSLLDSLNAEGISKLVDTLEQDKEELVKKLGEKEKKTKQVLESARNKIMVLQEKNKELMESDEKALIEKKNQEIERQKKEIEQAKMEKDKLRNALDSSISALRNGNLTLKNTVNDIKDEKSKQQEQIEQLQQELLASQRAQTTVSVHPTLKRTREVVEVDFETYQQKR